MWGRPFRVAWPFVAGLVALSGCATNPVTGRSQFALVSEQSAIASSTSAYTSIVGQLSKKGGIERGTPRAERVGEITNRLIAEAVRFRPDAAKWNWEVVVIRDPKTVNAFCMAGGKMGIFTGFWEKLNATDDEIANVMGHEIGHALVGHTAEKMSVAIATQIAAAVVAGIASRGSNDPYAFQRNLDMANLFAALGINLPNSREAETEADQIGIELAARAGFDPRAAVSLWNKMAARGGISLEFFATHPSPENRAQRLETLIAKVDPFYRAARDAKSPLSIPTFTTIGSNEREIGPVSREEYVARISAEPQVLTFVSEDFDKFKRGDVVLICRIDCALSYGYQKGDWKKLHDSKSWRDLAISVIRVGYQNDLTYFLLGEAAGGLNMHDAARTYYDRAMDAQKSGFTCAGNFDTCEGFDIHGVAPQRIADMQAALDRRPASPPKPIQQSAGKPAAPSVANDPAPPTHTASAQTLAGGGTHPDLMSAVMVSDKNAVNNFIERGANINERHKGFTYLIAAVINGDLEMVRLLVGKGADVSQVDSRGLSPMVYASSVRPSNPALIQFLQGVGATNPFAAR